jgi:regulatory protein
MAYGRVRKERPPLDEERLRELALAYVGRFATSRAKLATYLNRKLRERGWSGDGPPDLERIVERLAELGYVDDAAYAIAKSRSLTARGYGGRRVRQSLLAAGIGDDDAQPAHDHAQEEAVEAALRFAKRRRIGPFGSGSVDRADRERALAAMIRAGHSLPLAKAIVSLEPGTNVTIEMLAEKA